MKNRVGENIYMRAVPFSPKKVTMAASEALLSDFYGVNAELWPCQSSTQMDAPINGGRRKIATTIESKRYELGSC